MRFTMTDLFCGSGIGAIGFLAAGFDINYALDFNEYAVNTYNLNHAGKHAFKADVRELVSSDLPDNDIISGGFPCTPFSLGGSNRGENDERLGNLGYHFFRMIQVKKPMAFIVENVEGLTNGRHVRFFHSLIGWLESAGYNVAFRVVDCWDYGVPQTRNRVFIVGIRKDLGKHFVFPEVLPIHERPTMRQAISDLPFHPEGSNIRNHVRFVRGFSSRSAMMNRQRTWDEPSYTIVSNPRHLPLHPEPAGYDFRHRSIEQIHEDEKNHIIRRLTVRECLRLQSVPDWYYFPDIPGRKLNGILEKQHERCSGIPPIVAEKLGKRLIDTLTGDFQEPPRQKKLFSI